MKKEKMEYIKLRIVTMEEVLACQKNIGGSNNQKYALSKELVVELPNFLHMSMISNT